MVGDSDPFDIDYRLVLNGGLLFFIFSVKFFLYIFETLLTNSGRVLKYTFMKSSIKISFQDIDGKGIEPVILVNIINSDDPRDGLIKTLFQSVDEHLQLRYTHHTHIAINGQPDMDKSLILFKPRLTENQEKFAEQMRDKIRKAADDNDMQAMKNLLEEGGICQFIITSS